MLTITEDSLRYGQESAFEGFHGEIPGIFNDPFNGKKEIDKKLLDIIGKDNGFFVDIGPGDGISTSRTCFLENHGWQGILIEPDIELCARCTINRPKSAVLNYNCIQDDMSKKNPENVNNKQSDSGTGRINCRTLPSILDEFQIEGIDLLVLNTDEKQSLSILKGVDIFHYRIENILIMEAQRKVLAYLENAGCDSFELKGSNPYVNSVLCRFVESKQDIAEKHFSECHDFYVLERAWDIAARSNASYPGKYIAYYSLDMDGRHYPGERQWEERWKYIGKALREACGGDLNGKRVLELGCNLGLLSVWAAREGAVCQGYEYEADILEGARLVASSFGVADRCEWSQADFNKKEVTDSIVEEYDICTCLSVMNWVRNKDNLIEFLSRQKKVIYEGHDNDQVERERLARAGFTDIEKIVSSERNRSVFIARKDIQAEKRITWEDFEKQYGLKGVSFETPNVNTGDGNRVERIYFKESEIWKVRLSTKKNPAKFASPYEEARFLQRLSDVPNICRFKAYLETSSFTILILEYFQNIGTLDQVEIPPEFYSKIENQKHAVVKAVNERGILHNDILDRNFLVNSNYDICLIDFDQAQLVSGLNDYEHGRYSRFSRPVIYNTAGDDKTDNLKKLEMAWDIAAKSNASSPGRYLAYYSLNADGRFFHGEVPWSDRWKEIEKVLFDVCEGDFNGKHIVELGCNMGLVSIWAAKKGAVCHGYDRYADILEACKLNASAFGVYDSCKWDVIKFDSDKDCESVSTDYDLCICLSFMKWVKEKDSLLELLSRQKKVLYEGHDEKEVETARLKRAGFKDIRETGVSSRGRTIFLAMRNTGSGLKDEKAEMLSKAWNIAARSNASYPGKYIAYYSLDMDGRHYPGERPWEERWKYIGKALREACGGDLNGKRVLELGCNLGLLSVWAAREGAVCQGYEYEADILEGARLVASSFGVADRCEWSQADFNRKNVTGSISEDFDICTCLSVMNWVRDKDKLIELLSRQKVVIYEGHDNDEIETGRLRRAGFLEIKKVAVSERNRGIFCAWKDDLASA